MHHSIRLPLAIAATLLGAGFLPSLTAQTTTVIAPAGFATLPGNGGNAIPLWAGSGVYMQIHDAADLVNVFPTIVPIIKAVSFRIPNGGSLAARTVDIQVTVGVTPVTVRTATTTFANNLGPTPTVVTPYTNVNMPAVAQISNPNPQSWFFPFATPFTYILTQGNLCYEIRFKNLSATGGSFDVTSGSTANLDPFLGTGCVATGQTTAAAIGSRSLSLSTGAYVNRLDRGAANAPAAMLMGDTAQHIVLPGFCSAVETLPLVTLNGNTDAAGTWNLSLTFGNLYYFPRVTIYAQFLWLDAGLPNGVGVSNCSPVRLPSSGLARIWAGSSSTGQGNELATTGNRETTYPYGLVTGFDI